MRRSSDLTPEIAAALAGFAADKLVPTDAVNGMKPGSVIVDMAAEQGGNCELTEPGQAVGPGGVQAQEGVSQGPFGESGPGMPGLAQGRPC